MNSKSRSHDLPALDYFPVIALARVFYSKLKQTYFRLLEKGNGFESSRPCAKLHDPLLFRVSTAWPWGLTVNSRSHLKGHL